MCTAPAVLNAGTNLCDCPSPNVGTDGAAAPGTCAVPSAEVCRVLTPSQFYDSAAGACVAIADCLAPSVLDAGANLCDCPSPNVGTDGAAAPGDCAVPSAGSCGGLSPAKFYDSAAGACVAIAVCTAPAVLNAGTNLCDCPSPNIGTSGAAAPGDCAMPSAEKSKCETVDSAVNPIGGTWGDTGFGVGCKLNPDGFYTITPFSEPICLSANEHCDNYYASLREHGCAPPETKFKSGWLQHIHGAHDNADFTCVCAFGSGAGEPPDANGECACPIGQLVKDGACAAPTTPAEKCTVVGGSHNAGFGWCEGIGFRLGGGGGGSQQCAFDNGNDLNGRVIFCTDIFGPNYDFPPPGQKSYVYNCDPDDESGLIPATINTIGATECACPAGQAVQSGVCAACPVGQVVQSGVCAACPVGQVVQGGVCVACPVGQVVQGGVCVAVAACVAPAVLNAGTNRCDCPAPNIGTDGAAAPGDCVAPSAPVCRVLTPSQFYDAAAGACVAIADCRAPAVLDAGANLCDCPSPNVGTDGVVAPGDCAVFAPSVRVCGELNPPQFYDSTAVACVPIPDCRPTGATLNAEANRCDCPADSVSRGEVCIPKAGDFPGMSEKLLCGAFGGTVQVARGGREVCSGMDANDTFCIMDSAAGFPCRGLFKHLRACNVEFDRPALNPFFCGEKCGVQKAVGSECR